MEMVVTVYCMVGVFAAMVFVTISDGCHKPCIANWYLQGYQGSLYYVHQESQTKICR